ncbi:DNA-binding protein [Marinilabilia rubra]|uniref:DNA-binding protein n=1 Tax=Marinilabilia rubra TaxID=2162893 RepID=A0A2U2B6L7_9BACT|nr:DNA-binding protein [Marinilabilia rubra]
MRKVVKPPGFKGYKPYGASGTKGEAVELLYEEYEALKLADYDLMSHQEASELMGVSRATFARIYERARRKMAKALVEVKEIKSVYGHAWLDKSWFVCNHCDARFTMPSTMKERSCPVCKSFCIESLTDDK